MDKKIGRHEAPVACAHVLGFPEPAPGQVISWGIPLFPSAFQEPLPVAPHVLKRPSPRQDVEVTYHVRPGTAPLVVFRRRDKSGADRVPLDIAGRGQKGIPVYDPGRKPALPQVTFPSVPGVHHPRIPSVHLPERSCQPVSRAWNRQKMDMVRHEAVAPYLDPVHIAPAGRQFPICEKIPPGEKHPLPPVPPLGDVMGAAGHHHASRTGHGSPDDLLISCHERSTSSSIPHIAAVHQTQVVCMRPGHQTWPHSCPPGDMSIRGLCL